MSGPDRVRLRDITLDDADMLDAWDSDPANSGEFNDFGIPRDPIDREALARGPLRNVHNGQLIVELAEDGRAIGSVGWHRVRYGPNPESEAWNIGIALLPDDRGHGYGAEAQALLADYLFANSTVNRVEAQTDAANVGEQRSLERAGFVREGVARGSQYRAGAYRDLVTYSRLRGDPPR
jgi:RimJ/RimL family protein N-acetyltransferase